jgi:hypothetical protein
MYTHLSFFGGTALLICGAVHIGARAEHVTPQCSSARRQRRRASEGSERGSPAAGGFRCIEGIARSQGAIRHPANAGFPTRAQSL